MKRNYQICSLLLLAVVFQLPAQQNEADGKQFEETKTKAEKGDAFAQCALAEIYDGRKIVPQNYVEAAKWFHKAANQGLAEAQNNLSHAGLALGQGGGGGGGGGEKKVCGGS